MSSRPYRHPFFTQNLAPIRHVSIWNHFSDKWSNEKHEVSKFFGCSFLSRSKPSHDGGRYHIETSPLICSANQWTGFYMISASVMKGLKINLIFLSVKTLCLNFLYLPKNLHDVILQKTVRYC